MFSMLMYATKYFAFSGLCDHASMCCLFLLRWCVQASIRQYFNATMPAYCGHLGRCCLRTFCGHVVSAPFCSSACMHQVTQRPRNHILWQGVIANGDASSIHPCIEAVFAHDGSLLCLFANAPQHMRDDLKSTTRLLAKPYLIWRTA